MLSYKSSSPPYLVGVGTVYGGSNGYARSPAGQCMLKPQSPGDDDDGEDDDDEDDGGDYDDCDVVNTDFTVFFRDIATLAHVY